MPTTRPDLSVAKQPSDFSQTQRTIAVLLDAALAVCCYLMAYRLRFSGDVLALFLPSALRSLPIVMVSQVCACLIMGTYAHREGRRWLPRLVAGVLSGTGLAALLVYAVLGFEGISRTAFVIDAVFLVLTTFAWRAVSGLWRLARYARASEQLPDELVDLSSRTSTSVSAGLLGVFKYRELLRNLVIKDLRLKYRGSVFGFMWSLVNPLLMIGVYSMAFTYILRVQTENFVFFLLLGVLAWTFFANSAAMSTGSIIDSGALVKSMTFPRVILPIATVLFNFAQYMLTIVVFLPIMLVLFQVRPSATMLLFPVFLMLQILFTVGIAFMLATGTAFFRDIRHMLEVALSVMFWTTPIAYEFQRLPDTARLAILFSPMSPYVVAYQQIFYYRQWPDLSLWLIAIANAVGAFVIGFTLFVTYEYRFAEEL